MSYDRWLKYKLSDVCKIKYGKDHKKLSDGDIPTYGSGGIMRYVDSYLHDEPSVLIPRKGTLSNLFYVDKKFWTVDTLFWTIINDSIVLPKFLYYLLLTYRFEDMNVGSAVPSLTTALLNEVKISIPPLQEQKAIANILSSLDDKIELNNKINKNLEEMAQTLYKRWFVDFEFPNEDGEPYKSSGGEMIESELGLIPKGWEVDTLGNNVIELEAGNRPKGGVGKLDCGVPSIGAENVLGLGTYNYGNEKFISEDFFNKQKRGIVKNGDVMIYKDGAKLGRISYFDCDFPHRKCSINSHVFRVVTKSTLSQMYLYFWLDYPVNNNSLVNLNSNSAQPGINQTKLKSLKILVPKSEVLKPFSDITISLVEKILINAKESKSLSEIRDTLLPKLMSGEIEVPIEE